MPGFHALGSVPIASNPTDFTDDFPFATSRLALVNLVGAKADMITGFKMATNFTMTSGDTRTLVVRVKDAYGAAHNINGATIRWRAARSLGKTSSITKSTTGGVTIIDGVGGVFAVALAPADTASLSGVFFHEAEITEFDGTVTTVLTGTLKINRDFIAS